MRFLSVFALVLLAGCTTWPMLEELENQAVRSGNWAEVEKREGSLARRQARQAPKCPSGYIAYCEGQYRDWRCECHEKDNILRMFQRY